MPSVGYVGHIPISNTTETRRALCRLRVTSRRAWSGYNPAVSSDLVLMIRYGLKPGEPGRPLEHIGLNFWRVPEDYPANAKIE